LISGKSASIGIEDQQGQVAINYAWHLPAITNEQAIVFAPQGAPIIAPNLTAREVANHQLRLVVGAQPGQRSVLYSSPNINTWQGVETNLIPASGFWEILVPANGSTKFHRAAIEP
jgi:hypothetical protein